MRQPEEAEIFALVGQAELAAQTLELHITDDQIGLARRSVGNDGTLHTRNNGLDVWFIDAEDCRAVKWHAVHELDEGVLNVFERGVLVKMLAIDSSHHGDNRGEHQEAAVTFVRLHDEIFTFAESRRRARLVYSPADHKRGVKMRCRKD